MKRFNTQILFGFSLISSVFLGGCATGLQSSQPGKVSTISPYDAPSRADLDAIREPIPQWEPINTRTTQPYQVNGKTYTPYKSLVTYKERGLASWYGQRYQGKQTASGEVYDMYKITAAHPLLPIPSYARVSNLSNGKSVIVRINDRGPFIQDRLIDVSYVAAYKLGMLEKGTQEVEVESIIPTNANMSATPTPAPVTQQPTYTAQTYPVTTAPVQSQPPVTAYPVQNNTPRPTQQGTAYPVNNSQPPVTPNRYPVNNAPSPVPVAQQPAPVYNSTGNNGQEAPEGEEVTIQPLPNSTTPQPRPINNGTATPAPIPLPSFNDAQNTPVVERPGVYIQLGAFRTPESAENLRQRFLQQVLNNNNVVQVVIRDGFYKVHVGPFDSREQAAEVNQRLYQLLNLNGMIINK